MTGAGRVFVRVEHPGVEGLPWRVTDADEGGRVLRTELFRQRGEAYQAAADWARARGVEVERPGVVRIESVPVAKTGPDHDGIGWRVEDVAPVGGVLRSATVTDRGEVWELANRWATASGVGVDFVNPWGDVCKLCAGPSPLGIGYAVEGSRAMEASFLREVCPCGASTTMAWLDRQRLLSDPVPDGYFLGKARGVLRPYGVDRVEPLATWAARQRRDNLNRSGVVVDALGDLVAATYLHQPAGPGPSGWYVMPDDSTRLGLAGHNEIGLAVGAITRRLGRPVVHVRYDDVAAGRAAS